MRRLGRRPSDVVLVDCQGAVCGVEGRPGLTFDATSQQLQAGWLGQRSPRIIQARRLYHPGMILPVDVARIRLDNALLLLDEFVQGVAAHPDAATLRGLERRFAERLQIQPSYWSQIKGRSRQIGEKLARQFEQLCHKPHGWMDLAHSGLGANTALGTAAQGGAASEPADDDERFIVGLVLTYYRRHPQRARTRLLDLLGEVLNPGAEATAPPLSTPPPPCPAALAPGVVRPPRPSPKPPPSEADLWARTRQGVAPLKRK